MTDGTRLELKAGFYVERTEGTLRFTDEDGDYEYFTVHSERLAIMMEVEDLNQMAYAYVKGLGRGREQGRTGMRFDVWKALGFQEIMALALESESERLTQRFRAVLLGSENGD